ncbi:MAG: hypothetical protein HYT48_00320 [Candidatus Vogelbacteria bacterium]|nr:hypothetical protein [Candidatus Vogelbacteria bacterium]
MKEVGLFLGKFRDLKVADADLKQDLSDIIFNQLGIKLKPSDFNLSGDVVYLQAAPIIKSEILINRVKILAALGRKLEKII